MTRVITVASGKGGVGKTTVITNLGTALTKLGHDVIVLDGNVSTANVGIHLGYPNIHDNLHDVLRGDLRVSDVIYKHPESGLKFIPAGISLRDIKSDFVRDVEDVVMELIGSAEIILIDAAAGLGNEARAAIEAGDELIIVANPEIASVADASKCIELAREAGTKPIGFVLNRVMGFEWEMSAKNVEAFLELPLLGVVPEDAMVKRALYRTNPVVQLYPHSKAANAINAVAAGLVGEKFEPLRIKKSLFNRLSSFLFGEY